MNIVLIQKPTNALHIIYAAFRQCYSKGFVGDIWPKLLNNENPLEKQYNLITEVLESGHTSPIEHISFTFAIEGISRSLTHQLVRHRIASYSQQSQRYVGEGDPVYIIPKTIEKRYSALKEYNDLMNLIWQKYDDLILMGIPKEDARYILPNAAESKIVVTMNCRSLLNFFELRSCRRAQWEIRKMSNEMLKICQEVLPIVFQSAGAKCIRLGYCPENEKFSCGRFKK